jgi:hypothetical protein
VLEEPSPVVPWVVDEPRPVVPCVVDEPRPVVPWVVLEWLPVRSLAPTLPSLLRSRGFEVPVWVVEVLCTVGSAVLAVCEL